MQQSTLDFAVVVQWKDALVDVARGEGPFQNVFVSFLRFPFGTMASGQFSA